MTQTAEDYRPTGTLYDEALELTQRWERAFEVNPEEATRQRSEIERFHRDNPPSATISDPDFFIRG